MKGKLTVYKASAGSGKTYTLAYEYIKLLLGVKTHNGDYVLNTPRYAQAAGVDVQRRPHSRILAITFTNKATAEMKERIIKELHSLATMSDTPPADPDDDVAYAARLCEEFGCTRIELRAAASVALNELMFDYSQFNVSTIDSFFQTILRSFARELDRQGDYRIELDPKQAIAEAMSLFFDEINHGTGLANSSEKERKAVSDWLGGLAKLRVAEGHDFNPFNRNSGMYNEIVDNLGKIFSEKFQSREKEMFNYIADPAKLDAFEQWTSEKMETLTNACSEFIRNIKSMEREGLDKRFINYFDKFNPDKPSVEAILKGAYPQHMEAGNVGGLIVKKGDPELGQAYCDLFAEYLPVFHKIKFYREIRSRVNALRALMYVYRYIDLYRQENNLMLIADTNTLLGSIIGDGNDTPFIYERVGMQLFNFLIDEFQDTSRLQWRNLRPLVANALDESSDSLIIGDVKQSIYGWRGGDASLLDTQVESTDFPHHACPKGHNPGENTNYRSAHTVVRFNNTLFALLAKILNVRGYQGVEQSLGPKLKDLTGKVTFVDIKLMNREAALAPVALELGMDVAAMASLDDEDLSLHLMAYDMLQQIKRGYGFGDMAILCRENQDATKAANFLMENYPQIKLVSDEALLLRNCRSIKTIISILDIMDRSLGAPGIASAAQSSAKDRFMARRRQIHMLDTFHYELAQGGTVNEALKTAVTAVDYSNADDYDDTTYREITEIRAKSPASLPILVEAIIERKIPEAQRAQDLPYIAAFIDLVTDFCQNNVPSIRSFLAYWKNSCQKESVNGGKGGDAVTIITVHKAKGLEWPCVHIPQMDWMADSTDNEKWYDMDGVDEIPEDIRPPMMYLKNMSDLNTEYNPFADQIADDAENSRAENLNVLYVAFTRARRELRVHMLPNKKSENSAIRQYIMEALNQTPAPENTPTFDVYAQQSLAMTEGVLTMGCDTVREERKSKSTTANLPELPPLQMRVSFNDLNKPLATIADLSITDLSKNVLDTDNAPTPEQRGIVDKPAPSGNDNPELRAAARRGILMHAILAEMYTPDDIDHAVDLLRQSADPAELDECRQIIQSKLETAPDIVQQWFGPDTYRVINEQDLYCTIEDKLHRADRIVWLDRNTVHVVDYKFTSTEHDEHITQVRDYAANLSDLYGVAVTPFLWYPLLDIVRRV